MRFMRDPFASMSPRKLIARLVIALIILFAVIQLVPYGRNHVNPVGNTEPQWNSPETRALAQRACFNCHSNQTEWPWYSHVAPVSWLVQRDVNEGREHLNFSEWQRQQRHAGKSAEEVKEGGMPPWFFLPLHPEARLTESEKQLLIKGLEATFPH
jgi:hypothetical protein